MIGSQKCFQLTKGQYLYFLNNDTRILENCLESLVKLIINNPQVGAVGSKLILANSIYAAFPA